MLTNTIAAITIGLLVANVLKPGRWWRVAVPASVATSKSFDLWGLLQDMVPPSIAKPLVDNNLIQLIFVALSFGVVLRSLKAQQIAQGK